MEKGERKTRRVRTYDLWTFKWVCELIERDVRGFCLRCFSMSLFYFHQPKLNGAKTLRPKTDLCLYEKVRNFLLFSFLSTVLYWHFVVTDFQNSFLNKREKKNSPKLVYLLTDRLACRLAKLLTEEYLSLPLTYQTDWTANNQFTVEQSEHSFSSLIFLIAQSNNWLSCKNLPLQAKRPCLLHSSSMQNCNGHSPQ